MAHVSGSGCRVVLRGIFFKYIKIDHLHRGDPIQNIFFGKNRNFLNFLFPKNSFNAILSASRDMSMPYFAWIDCDLMILGRKTPFLSIIDTKF